MIIIWLIAWLLSDTPPLKGDVLLGLSTWGVVGAVLLLIALFAHR